MESAKVFVGARRSSMEASRFAGDVAAFCGALQSNRPAGLDGAIVAIADSYVAYWEHWVSSTAATDNSRIGSFAEIASPVLLESFSPTAIESELNKPTDGPPVSGGACFNTQFSRLDATS